MGRGIVRRRLAVSAVSFTEGGPLLVLQEFVNAACEVLPADWEIVVFVHDRRLISAARARLVEMPAAKRSWMRRLWVEWHELRRQADTLQPDLWVSLHDMSPNVGGVRQAVYCHNPAPFFPVSWQDVCFEPRQLAFRLAYGWLYRINLRRNCAVIVQQSWLRDAFRKWTGPTTPIIVAHPHVPGNAGTHAGADDVYAMRRQRPAGRCVFLYPALPRPFKNVELIGRAVARLETGAQWRSEVILTLDGTENRYARWLKRRFGKLQTLRFCGIQPRAAMDALYASGDCLLFPSRMETWGLPITEAKEHRLPMFVANLPYARETVGTYDRVDFIDGEDFAALADKLLAFQDGHFAFQAVTDNDPEPPFVSGWPELVRALMANCSRSKSES